MTSWSILRFPATDFAAMTKAHLHELFMKGCCVYSSSVKRMFTVNHEQFPIQMTQTCKHSACLQILAGEDFPLKLLWRTPIKVHQRLDRRQPRNREHRLAQRRQGRISAQY